MTAGQVGAGFISVRQSKTNERLEIAIHSALARSLKACASDHLLPLPTFFQPLAAREGLEPPTFALGKRCSILLSYRADRWG